MTEKDIYDINFRLINWARWCRDGKVKGRCKSIEHRYDYRSARMDGEEVVVWEAGPVHFEVDSKDAVLVNRAWQALPVLNNKLITAHYIPRKSDYKAACRALGFRFSEYEANLMRSQQMVVNLLKFFR